MSSTTASLQQQIAETQISFRIQNERIQASADSLGMTGPIPFICECANAECTELLCLSFDEYESIRQHPRGFFNVTGHEASSVEVGAERVVTVIGGLTLVRKIGLAGDLAAGDQGDRHA